MREIADVSMGWDKKLLPQLPYQEQVTRSTATNDMFSEWNSSGSMNRLNSWFVRAMLALHDKDKADTCVVEVREGMDYAAEHTCENGDTVIVSVNAKGQISGCKVDTTDHYSNLVISKTCKENLTPLYACYIMLLGNMNVTQDENVSNRCKEALSTFLATEDILDAQKEMFYLNDTLYTGFKKEKINGNIQNGSINQIMKGQISGRSGKVICGTPKFLNRGANGAAKAKVETFGTVKAEFEKFAKTRKWSKTEEKLIPNFPDNYPVLPEVKTITKAYAESREAKRPFNNILWRGTTAYGKSTGVEMIAALLHTPLLRVTCKSTMDTEDFKAQFVPDSGESNESPASDNVPELSATEIFADPASAFEKLTDEYREEITADEVLDEYISMKAKAAAKEKAPASNSLPRYKLVQPNYIKGLTRGYIVEIQEMSRIKDPGVLVGLNEYDHAGASIELPNGTYVTRHKDTMAIFTDNVGYASCRAVDPSVIRRMDLVIDSFELSDEQILARVKYNTDYEDDDLLKHMLKVLKEVMTYCKENDLREGDISVFELEAWVRYLQIFGEDMFEDGCTKCIVSKVSPDREVQEELQRHLAEGVLSENIKRAA